MTKEAAVDELHGVIEQALKIPVSLSINSGAEYPPTSTRRMWSDNTIIPSNYI
jgi:hypothetical protein